MTASSVDDVVQALADHALIKPSQVEELKRLPQRQSDPKALVQTLVQRGWLTAYQAKRLLQGHSAQLTLGAYVILEPLGEGGMGHIFKARHPGLDRLAAIKVLRKDLVADEEAVQRFLREIKLASQLSKHPHLVHAFDAGTVAGTYYLAMEYIEGIDLDRLVGQAGPLPMQQACDYIRQAALGLQHAHEQSLVHRDIKPANLLVAPKPDKKCADWGTVKILDLGLARLHGKGTSPGQTMLTTDGTVTMGTIDYQAPEQALDFHRADIRADIYSLGCTFFYLLTGKPPFGNGPLAVKLMRHQQAELPDLKERRRDVPDGLIPIVRRMLAKKPADRYQTPGEVAAALAKMFPPKSPDPTSRALQRHDGARWLALLGQGARLTLRLAGAATRVSWQAVKRRPRLVLGGTVSLALGVALVWWLLGPTSLLGTWPSTPITELTARTGLARLRSRAAEPGADAQALWRDVLAFRMKYPGTPEAAAAAELQMQLPSPLDLLDPARIKDKTKLPPEAVAVIQGHRLAEHHVKFSPDGRTIALCGDPTHLELALYDLAGPEPKLLANLAGHTAPLAIAAFSPDGKLVASGSADQTVRLWDLSDTKPKALRVLEGHAGNIRCLAFAPDGKTLASGSEDRTVRLWNLAAAEPPAPTVLPIKGRIASVAFSQDGKTLATGSYDGNASLVKLWDLTESPPKVRSTLNSAIDSMALAPDGKRVAAGNWNDGHASLFDLTDPAAKPLQLAHWHDGGVRTVQFSVDGKVLFTCDGVGRPRWWDATSGKILQARDVALPTPRADLAPDGRHVAAAPSGNTLYILRFAPPPDQSNR